MFLKCYVEIPVAFEDVGAALLHRPEAWLQRMAEGAGLRSDRLLVGVGLDVGGHSVRRPARIEVGEPQVTPRTASLPLQLRVEGREGLFPSFRGSLDAAWLGTGRTHLALTAQYEPPLGVVGRIADRALFHRVAEVVAQDFLHDVAAQLTAGSAVKANGNGNVQRMASRRSLSAPNV